MKGLTLLRVNEVAEYLDMSKKAIYQRIYRGTLPGVIKVGRSIRIHKEKLDEAMKGDRSEQEVEPMNFHDFKLFAQVIEDHWDHKTETFVPPGYAAAAKRLEKQKLIVFNPTNRREVRPTQAGELLANTMVDMLKASHVGFELKVEGGPEGSWDQTRPLADQVRERNG